MTTSDARALSTLLIVDDHPLIRRALSDSVSHAHRGCRVLTAATAEEALVVAKAHLQAQSRVIVLMDLGLPGLSGLSAIQAMQQLGGSIEVITVSGTDDEAQVSAALGAGAMAFVSKGAPIEGLLQVVSEAISDRLPRGTWLSTAGYRDSSELKQSNLTERQMQVLAMICEGKSNREISDALGISEITAKSHVGGVFKVLGVVSRTQAVLAAQRMGLSRPAR
jgi:two-component system nitrate/nitrite response regulator NarL